MRSLGIGIGMVQDHIIGVFSISLSMRTKSSRMRYIESMSLATAAFSKNEVRIELDRLSIGSGIYMEETFF